MINSLSPEADIEFEVAGLTDVHFLTEYEISLTCFAIRATYHEPMKAILDRWKSKKDGSRRDDGRAAAASLPGRRGLAGRFDTYDLLSISLIAIIVALALTYWDKFPLFRDIYYHMGVTEGYSMAGGVSLRAFWEYAPAGRAQLYPPFLHVIMYSMNWCGLSITTVGRIVSFSGFPLLLLSNWYGVKKLFSKKAAFYCAVLLSSVYIFFWQASVTNAATLVLILAPLDFVAFERDRKVAACVLLALALYSHLVLGHVIALALLVYAMHRRGLLKETAEVLAGAYVLWLPWGIYILANYNSLSLSGTTTSGGVTIHGLLWAVALAGAYLCYRKKGRYYLLPSFLIAMVPMAFFYSDRFWDAHVFLPLAMLGAVALASLDDALRERASKRLRGRTWSLALVAVPMAAIVALFLFVDPVISTGNKSQMPSPTQGTGSRQSTEGLSTTPPGDESTTTDATGGSSPHEDGGDQATPRPPVGTQPEQSGSDGAEPPTGTGVFRLRSTTLLGLLGDSSGNEQQSLLEEPLASAEVEELAGLIEENSEPDQILFCPDPSLGNLLTALTGRSSTGGMFQEVKPESEGNQVEDAYLLVPWYVQEIGISHTFEVKENQVEDAYLLILSRRSQPPSSEQGSSSSAPFPPPSQSSSPASPAPASSGSVPSIPELPTAGHGQATQQAQTELDLSGYELIGSAGDYELYVNPSATSRTGEAGAVIPWYVVFALLGLALAAAGVDWFRRSPVSPGDGETRPAADGESGSTGDGPHERNGRGGALAIVPCYNEAGCIGTVVRELKEAAPSLDVLVIDDGSKDGTAAAARRAGAAVLCHRHNHGIGATVRTGMLFALESGYDYAVQVDGDGQHDPSFIPVLLGPLEKGSADVVTGSRFLGTDGYKPPFVRRLGTRVLSRAVSLATGRKATDTSSGFRAMNRRALSFLAANYPDDYPESESLVLMYQAGIRWMEVPVVMRSRTHGTSSIRGLVGVRFVATVLFRIALDTLGFRAPTRRAHGGELAVESN